MKYSSIVKSTYKGSTVMVIDAPLEDVIVSQDEARFLRETMSYGVGITDYWIDNFVIDVHHEIYDAISNKMAMVFTVYKQDGDIMFMDKFSIAWNDFVNFDW